MTDMLESMKDIEICENKVTIKSVMKEADKAAIKELAEAMM